MAGYHDLIFFLIEAGTSFFFFQIRFVVSEGCDPDLYPIFFVCGNLDFVAAFHSSLIISVIFLSMTIDYYIIQVDNGHSEVFFFATCWVSNHEIMV